MTTSVNLIATSGAGGTAAAIAAGVGINGLAYITGTLGVGNVLTANTVPGLTGTSWQWTRNGTNIGAATSSTYTQVTADIGTSIAVVVNGIITSASVQVPGILAVFSAAPTITNATTAGAVTWTAGTLSNVGTPTATITYNVFSNGTLVASNATSGVTYTPPAIGPTITVQEVATNSAGAATSTSAGVVVTAAPATLLRFAAAENRYPVAVFTTLTTKLTFFVRRTVHIGSSDLSGVVVSLGSTLLAGTAEINAGAYNITSMALEKISGTPQSQPVLFNGGRTKAINAGDSDIQSDVLLSSAFGLSAFTRGDTYAIRLMGTVASTGVTLPAMESVYTAQPTDYDISYDPTSGTGGGGATGFVVDATGAPTPTLTVFSFMTTARFCCQLLGYMPPTAKVTAGVGDSIMSGKNNTETNGFIGFYGRTLLGPDGSTATAVLAGCNFGLSGSTSSLWTTTPKAQAMFKYANIMVEEFGINGGSTAGQMTLCQGLWAAFKAAAPAGTNSYVIRTKLMTVTTCTQSVSSLTSTGTACTATVGGTPPPNGASIIISGATPAAYNGTFTVTSVAGSVVNYTALSSPGSSATGTILWSDQFATDANQVKDARVANGAASAVLWNGSLDTQAAGTPGFTTLVDFQAITKGTGGDRYLWNNNGTANYATSDGTHPGPNDCIPMAVQQRAVIDAYVM